MFSVILLVVIALVFGVFATQNTIGIPITIGSLVIPDVPLYIVLGVTLLIGLRSILGIFLVCIRSPSKA
jgi:hypothetical protein